MFRRYVPREKGQPSQVPSFDHDPNSLRFRSWTALLSLSGQIPSSCRKGEVSVFLEEEVEAYEAEVIAAGQPVSLRNPTRFALTNIGIVCGRTGEPVFHAHELPPGRFLQMEFLKEGNFTVHYSPAFSGVTLRRNLRVVSTRKSTPRSPSNFQPRLKANQ